MEVPYVKEVVRDDPVQIARNYDLNDIQRALFLKLKLKKWDVARFNQARVDELMQVVAHVLVGARQLRITMQVTPETTIFTNTANVLSQSVSVDGQLSIDNKPVVDYLGFLHCEAKPATVPLHTDTFRAVIVLAQHLIVKNGETVARDIPTTKVFDKAVVYTTIGDALPHSLKTIVDKVWLDKQGRTYKGKEFASEIYRRIVVHRDRDVILDDIREQCEKYLVDGFFANKQSKVCFADYHSGHKLNFADGKNLDLKCELASYYLNDMRAARGEDNKDMSIGGNSSGLPYNLNRTLSTAMYMSSSLFQILYDNRLPTVRLLGVGSNIANVMNMSYNFLKAFNVTSVVLERPNALPGTYLEDKAFVNKTFPAIKFYSDKNADITINFEQIASQAKAGVKLDDQYSYAYDNYDLKDNEVKLTRVFSSLGTFLPYKSPHNLMGFVFGKDIKFNSPLVDTPEKFSEYLKISMQVNFVRNFPFVARISPYAFMIKMKYAYLAQAELSFKFLLHAERAQCTVVESGEYGDEGFLTEKIGKAREKQFKYTREVHSLHKHAYGFEDAAAVMLQMVKMNVGDTIDKFCISHVEEGRYYDHIARIHMDIRLLPSTSSTRSGGFFCRLANCECDYDKPPISSNTSKGPGKSSGSQPTPAQRQKDRAAKRVNTENVTTTSSQVVLDLSVV